MINNFENNLSITSGTIKSSMTDLYSGCSSENKSSSIFISGKETENHTLQTNQLDTIVGVYIPCMSTILGATLFLRLTWAVGQAGFLSILGILLLSGTAVFLTALSISAMSTNGSMGGGGAYYMISRSIGPEFGGAVGIIFYLANAGGTTFHLLAFSDNVMETFFTENDKWMKILIGSITLFCTLVAGWIGAGFFSKLNVLIFSIIIVSIVTAVFNMFLGDSFGCTEINSGGIDGFTGPDSGTLSDNMLFSFGPIIDDTTGEMTNKKNDIFRIFTIIFPAMTGIMAGANMSGDLKDPGRSIGKGTISAILSCLLIYIIISFSAAWTMESDYLKQEPQAIQQISCWGNGNGEIIIIAGVYCSTLSSALGAIAGAARILQAFCKDFSDIQPTETNVGSHFRKFLNFLSYGSPNKNEPRHAVIFTWAISQCLLFFGSLDILASIITNCFLLTYFSANISCFVLSISGAPNFRPRFKFFSWHTAILGAFLNILIMYLASPIMATISILIMLLLFMMMIYSAPLTPWGDVSQAIIFHQVRKYLLRLDERKSHPKFWRPSILLLVDDPLQSMGLIDFCNNLKKGGLYVIGDILVGNLQSVGFQCLRLQELWNEVISMIKVKAFSEVVLAPTYRQGAQCIMMSAGLGGLKPNTVVFPFPNHLFHSTLHFMANHSSFRVSGDVIEKLEELKTIHDGVRHNEGDEILNHSMEKIHDGTNISAEEFVGMILDAFFLHKNLLIARNFQKLDKGLIVSNHEGITEDGKKIKKKERKMLYIDIWYTDDLDKDCLHSGCLSLMLQLAYGLHRSDIWQECTKIRIVQLLYENENEGISEDMLSSHNSTLSKLLEESRIQCEFHVFSVTTSPGKSCTQTTNEFIKAHISETAIMFLNLKIPQDNHTDCREYLNYLKVLTDGLPPTVLTSLGQRCPVITTEI